MIQVIIKKSLSKLNLAGKWRRVSGWEFVAKFAKYDVLPVSVPLMVIVPLLARLEYLLNEGRFGFIEILFNLLDSRLIEIPVNMQRGFWLAFLATCIRVLYQLGCPDFVKKRQTCDEWMESIDGEIVKKELELEFGEERAEDVMKSMHERYLAYASKNNLSAPIIRYPAVLFVFLSIYILFAVLADQFLAVFKVTNIQQLLLHFGR